MISPLLANIDLHPLDMLMVGRGYRIAAKPAEKTHVRDCRVEGKGFEFVMPKACLPHGAIGSKPVVRRQQVLRAQIKLRQAEGEHGEKKCRTRGQGLARAIAALNPVPRGWS